MQSRLASKAITQSSNRALVKHASKNSKEERFCKCLDILLSICGCSRYLLTKEKEKLHLRSGCYLGCEIYNGKPILQMADAFHSYFFAEIVLEFYRWVRKKRIEDVLSRPFSIL